MIYAFGSYLRNIFELQDGKDIISYYVSKSFIVSPFT